MDPRVESAAVAVPAASRAVGRVVSRLELFERLGGAGRVTVVSGPAGSGKTFLLGSWIAEAGLEDRTAWVSVVRGEHDTQRFWLSVLNALRDTAGGPEVVRALTAAPDLDGWTIVERLLEDLTLFEAPIWLVVDDIHELHSEEALRQLELLLMRSPPELRFVLLTRHDGRLGLHRLRLEGGLSEIRAPDLRFSRQEARALFELSGIQLSESALGQLHERTEGWVAGLKLAALSLAGHPDPERFAREFSGSERAVSEYLLVEVLERQPGDVQRLLLGTSVLERVNGELADVMTGGSGGERILRELDEANAFVTSLDAGRSWFRYHHLFADLLQGELRRAMPDELPALHHAAADWLAEHGHPAEAVRHAQAAQDWTLATHLLSDHWFGLYLDGQAATAHDLLTRFPSAAPAENPELAAMVADDELNRGSLDEAARHLALATRNSGSVRESRRGRFEVMLAILRLSLARQRGDLPAVVEQAERLLGPIEDSGLMELGMSEEYRALALVSLGIAEAWTARFTEAERHLNEGISLSRRIGRPYLELTALVHSAVILGFRLLSLLAERSMEAIELAERHGWADEQITAVAYAQLGGALGAQGRLEEADRWLARARPLRAELQPAAGLLLHLARANVALARGQEHEAVADYQAAERLAEHLVTPHALETRVRGQLLQALVRIGETEQVERAFAEMDDAERDDAALRIALALLRLAQGDPRAAISALTPVLDGSAPAPAWIVGQACLLEARVRDHLGDAAGAQRALERALDAAEPDGILLPFLLHPVPELLERHLRHRTAHPSLISDILTLLHGRGPQPDGAARQPLREPLSDSETRVLRYLATNLSNREIADELYVSVHTVKTHTKHLYAKLDAHGRSEAVERARGLGLLAPSLHSR